METDDLENLRVLAKQLTEGLGKEEARLKAARTEAIATLRAALSELERRDTAPVVTIHKGCGGIIGYDAWIDSNGEICGGPYDNFSCMKCGEDDPSETEIGQPDEY